MRRNKINVLSTTYSAALAFCKKNDIEVADMRRIRGVQDIFGIWQGDLYVIYPAGNSRGFSDIVWEASQRGLQIKYRHQDSLL